MWSFETWPLEMRSGLPLHTLLHFWVEMVSTSLIHGHISRKKLDRICQVQVEITTESLHADMHDFSSQHSWTQRVLLCCNPKHLKNIIQILPWGQHCTLFCYVLYHEINATNLWHHPWHSNTEYALICLILRSDQKIDANAWYLAVYTMFAENMDHVMPCSPGTWCCTDENNNVVHFCTSRDTRWTNHDCVLQIVI